MAVTNFKAMLAKLNKTCTKALENAAGLCQSRTNYNIEIEHWLVKLLETPDTDLPRLFKHYGIDPDIISRPGPRIVEAFEQLARNINPTEFQ